MAVIIFSYGCFHAIEKLFGRASKITGETKSIWSLESPIQITVCKIDQFVDNNEIGFDQEWDYYKGQSTNKAYLSWNGLEGNLTANQTINHLFLTEGERVWLGNGPSSNTSTVLPNGQCKHFKGLPRELLNPKGNYKNDVELYIREMIIDSSYQVFVSDPAAAPKFQLPKPLLTGRIEAIAVNHSKILYYNVILKETQMELDDGSCVNYPNAAGHNSYADCVEEENQRKILPVLGCMPPWLSDKSPCNKPFLMLTDEHANIQTKIFSIYAKSKTGFHYESASCPLPCTQISVNTIYQDVKYTTSSARMKFNLFFEETVKVERIGRAYTMGDLLVEIGSQLGLWLGICVVGMFDILVLVLVKLRDIKNQMFKG